MKQFIVLAVLFALALANPKISDDFTAWTVVTEFDQHHMIQLTEHIYESYSTKQQRIDTWFNNTYDQIYHTEQQSGNPLMHVVVDHKYCYHMKEAHSLYPFFDWVAKATQNHECSINLENGKNYHFEDEKLGMKLNLCVGTEDTHVDKPLGLMLETHRGDDKKLFESITFESFDGTTPPASTFVLPKICDKSTEFDIAKASPHLRNTLLRHKA
eukprot:TRINITY_DN214_c5_g1_i1.p1 TRINITY_DN214_c5_g1~~TRINITY_DN214_c5_g1_i1.p1  ORF type:complete len:213 (-),score=45.72 TRINITY_DN214_c5_g1_i1:47-685(-)